MGSRPLIGLIGLATVSCVGNIGGDVEQGPPPPPDVAPLDVPAAPDKVEGQGFCVTLQAGESVQSVSPEGHAWLAKAGSGVQQVRIVDPLDEAGIVSDELELGELLQVQAWTGGDAAIVAGDGLWRLEELARIQLTPPTDSMSTPSICGDPGFNGFLLADELLYERRTDEQWWVWDPEVDGSAAPSAIVDYDGECLDTGDTMWLTAEDGTLWQLTSTQVYRPVQFASFVDAAATAEMLAILEADRLWIGPDAWQLWVFPGTTPKQISASGGAIWMTSGQQLLRFDGENWVEVTHDVGAPIVDVIAHANGAWLVTAGEACHVSTDAIIRLEGLRPYTRSKDLDYVISVSASSGDTVTASIGGEDAALSLNPETGAYEGTVRLDTVGWHDLVLSAGDMTRVVPVKRLPEIERSWASDILPLYEANCSGTDCHGSSPEAPDLSTYEAWQNHDDAIRSRVVDAQTMPPASAQTAEWGADQIEIIAQWLEGGMLP